MAVTLLVNMAYADENVSDVDETTAPDAIRSSAFYLGFGLGQGYVDDDQTDEEMKATTLTLLAGYRYNRYIALEGRYAFGLNMDYDPGRTSNRSDDYDGDFSSWGIYLKPMLPVQSFSLYALLGYGGVMLKDLEEGDAYEDGFQWGLGAQYAFDNEMVLFADYVKLYDGTGFDYRAQREDVDADVWCIGLSYRF